MLANSKSSNLSDRLYALLISTKLIEVEIFEKNIFGTNFGLTNTIFWHFWLCPSPSVAKSKVLWQVLQESPLRRKCDSGGQIIPFSAVSFLIHMCGLLPYFVSVAFNVKIKFWHFTFCENQETRASPLLRLVFNCFVAAWVCGHKPQWMPNHKKSLIKNFIICIVLWQIL